MRQSEHAAIAPDLTHSPEAQAWARDLLNGNITIDNSINTLIVERDWQHCEIEDPAFGINSQLWQTIQSDLDTAKRTNPYFNFKDYSRLPLKGVYTAVNLSTAEDKLLENFNLASVIIAEAAAKNINTRVMPVPYQMTNGQACFQGNETSLPILKLSDCGDTKVGLVETLATIQQQQMAAGGQSSIWISPPKQELGYGTHSDDNLNEGRIVVWDVRPDGRANSYNLACQMDGQEVYLKIYNRLKEFSETEKAQHVQGVDDIRAAPLSLPSQQLWQILQAQVPELQESWRFIQSGQADQLLEKALQDISRTRQQHQHLPTQTLRQQRYQNLAIETALERLGWTLMHQGPRTDGCALTARDEWLTNYGYGGYSDSGVGYSPDTGVGYLGSIMGRGADLFLPITTEYVLYKGILHPKVKYDAGEKKYFVVKCPVCNTMLEKHIPAGKSECCGNEFKGC